MRHIPALDGLRGVAILLVLAFHAGVPWLEGGFIGVDIFFVLSGYLITSILLAEYAGTGTVQFGRFYLRRALRLAPALFVVLAVYVLASGALNQRPVDALIALLYTSNWERAFGHQMGLLGHTWSLSIEEQFYLAWPLLLFLMLRFVGRRVVIALLALGLAGFAWGARIALLEHGYSFMRIYNGLDTRADSLMVGCALGAFMASGVSRMARPFLHLASYALTPAAIVCLLLLAIAASWHDPILYQWGFVLAELSAAALLLDITVNKHGPLSRFLSARWLTWVGSISYGLYLWHYPVYEALFKAGLRQRYVVVAGTILTFGIAAWSYYFVERPALRLKNRLSDSPAPWRSTARATLQSG